MEIPTSRNQRHGLPSIYRDHSRPGPTTMPITLPSISSAMTIPGTSDMGHVPPPLPPPRYVLENPMDHGHRPAPSNYGSMEDEKPSYQSRHERDEGYASLSSFGSAMSTAGSAAPRIGLSHDHYYQFNNRDYDTSLKKKLDARRTVEDPSPPRRLSGLGASIDMARVAPSSFVSLPLPMRPARPSVSTPDNSAASPRSTPFNPVEYRSPSEVADSDRSPYRPRRTGSGSVTDEMASTQGSVADETEFAGEETSGMRRLKLEDSFGRSSISSVASGTKRRASSPPGEEPYETSLHAMGSDAFRRRDLSSRGSPTPRLSIPSISHAGSYCSTLSAAPTTMSPYTHARLSSSSGPSPMVSDPGLVSAFAPGHPLGGSGRGSMLRSSHQRHMSESRPMASPRKLNDCKPGVARLQGFLMCECCPKKPKKFDTQEELSAHEAEKQYECSFCGNRFKNKNEAERHQNSLHVRRHSWSCSALSHYDRAFHDSTTHPGETDTCGYCGEEFKRRGGTGRMRQATEQDWEDRIRHLQEVHKFRECNSAKKFYRADHFRQHLKHSHAGTSGKWTNMLENACMMEEGPSPR